MEFQQLWTQCTREMNMVAIRLWNVSKMESQWKLLWNFIEFICAINNASKLDDAFNGDDVKIHYALDTRKSLVNFVRNSQLHGNKQFS